MALTEFETEVLKKLERLVVAVESRGGSKSSSSSSSGAGKRRAKPDLSKCSQAIGWIKAVELARTKAGDDYVKIGLDREGGGLFQVSAFKFSCDVHAVKQFAEDAKEAGARVVIFYTRKEDSKYPDFADIGYATDKQAASAGAAPAEPKVETPF